MNKVILFGLDGASFNIIKPWVEKGYLPAFAHILQEGSSGVLKSTYPPVTVPAWAAMLTGKNPGRLGYHDFSERKNGSYHFGSVNIRWDEIDPVWKIASDLGKRVCIFNVPTTPLATYPLNGVFVAGPGPLELGLGARWAIPESVNNLLKTVDYKNAHNIPQGLSTSQLLMHMKHLAELQCKLATQFLKQEQWDLYIFCLFVTDLAEHICLGNGRDMSALLSIYKIADLWLSNLLENMPKKCNLLIVSDHGQTEGRSFVDLNTWLMNQGFLVTKPNRRRWLSRAGIYNTLSRWKLFPLYKRLTAKKHLAQMDVFLKKCIPWENKLVEITDWSQTQAYSISTSGIFINLQGREPQGFVRTSDYDVLREKIITALQTLTCTETGMKVIRRVHRREEVYRGEFLEKMPDVVIEWEDGYGNIVSEGIPRRDTLHYSKHRFHSGVHTRDGIFMAYGPDIERDKDIGIAQIVDVAPTLLHLMGIPIPNDIDGQVQINILKSISQLRNLPKFLSTNQDNNCEQKVYSPEEENAIKKRLKDLGYLD